jgi:hypothetical protein
VTAQQYGAAIAQGRSDFVAENVSADQQRGVVDRCAAVKVINSSGW